jgi:hypothetical protein
MPLTPQNSEEQAMLDLMEIRGFKVEDSVRGPYLVTPDGYHYAVQLLPQVSAIACIFAGFEKLNPVYK